MWYKFNLKTTKDSSPNLGFVQPPMESQNKRQSNQGFAQPPPQVRSPIVNEKKIGRNEKVKIRKGDETKIIKWKKAQALIESGEWSLEE